MIRKLAILLLFLSVSVAFAQDYTLYKVKRKATVETVAFLNEITPEQLLRANPTINPAAKLSPGTVVRIPVKQPVQKEQQPSQNGLPVSQNSEPANQNNQQEVDRQNIQGDLHQQPLVAFQPAIPACDTIISYDADSKKLRIAALLPFEDPKLAQSMCEIYSGMLVAASDLSSELERDIEIFAYSTSDLSETHLDVILSGKDLVVGPVYKESLEKVAKWAAAHKIPVVSPLMSFDIPENPYVIMMAPSQMSKDGPLKEYLTPDKNIIMIDHSVYSNKTQTDEFLKVVPSVRRFAYSRELVTPQDLMPLVDPTRLNVFLVPTEHQGAIEDVVSKITAINSPVKLCDIAIVGMPSWLNLSNFSQVLLFRGNVSCVSSYYFDRQNVIMSSFFDDYINAFDRIPSKFVLRGYDIVDIMANAMAEWGGKTLMQMDGEEFIPLMNPYRFVRDSKTGNLCNERWVLVTFQNNYSVNIK